MKHRRIDIFGHQTSLALEPEYWDFLKEIMAKTVGMATLGSIKVRQVGQHCLNTGVIRTELAPADADHPDVGASLNSLALIYEAEGRYADAEPLYRRSLLIAEKAFGLDHPNVARSP
jgi:hypothetical protein